MDSVGRVHHADAVRPDPGEGSAVVRIYMYILDLSLAHKKLHNVGISFLSPCHSPGLDPIPGPFQSLWLGHEIRFATRGFAYANRTRRHSPKVFTMAWEIYHFPMPNSPNKTLIGGYFRSISPDFAQFRSIPPQRRDFWRDSWRLYYGFRNPQTTSQKNCTAFPTERDRKSIPFAYAPPAVLASNRGQRSCHVIPK